MLSPSRLQSEHVYTKIYRTLIFYTVSYRCETYYVTLQKNTGVSGAIDETDLSGTKRYEVTEDRKKCILRTSQFTSLSKCYSGGEIEEDKMEEM
jgi:hypothetical protein